jgi:hypothetical protein
MKSTEGITYEIPNKLESRNFEELRLLMLATNVRLGGKVFYDIHPPKTEKGRWYAFFYEKMDHKSMVKEQLSKVTKES